MPGVRAEFLCRREFHRVAVGTSNISMEIRDILRNCFVLPSRRSESDLTFGLLDAFIAWGVEG